MGFTNLSKLDFFFSWILLVWCIMHLDFLKFSGKFFIISCCILLPNWTPGDQTSEIFFLFQNSETLYFYYELFLPLLLKGLIFLLVQQEVFELSQVMGIRVTMEWLEEGKISTVILPLWRWFCRHDKWCGWHHHVAVVLLPWQMMWLTMLSTTVEKLLWHCHILSNVICHSGKTVLEGYLYGFA